MTKGDIKTLKWDTNTGKAPKVGQIIQNTYLTQFKVIKAKGNQVTIEQIT